MVKTSRKERRVVVGHLWGIGVLKSTEKRYWYAIMKFFQWRRRQGIAQPRTMECLDAVVGEYINYLFQRRDPQYLGHDLVSGLKRYYPRTKHAMHTARMYLLNWNSTIERKKAIPLSSSLAKAFSALALSQGRVRQGLLVLVCFLGILWVSEALNLRAQDFLFLQNGQLILLLHDTKKAKTQGTPESCRINDLLLCKVFKKVLAGG